MKKLFLSASFLIAAAIVFSPLAHGFSNVPGSCGADCKSCHVLKKEEAQDIINSFNPKVTVIEVREAEVGGLWEIDLLFNGRKGVTYIDYSKKHLIDNAKIVDVKTKRPITDERLADLNRVDLSKVPLKDSLILGQAKAPIKVVIFDDPE